MLTNLNEIVINNNVYKKIDCIKYNDISFSDIYENNKEIIIIDTDICNGKYFDYLFYTNMQNKYIKQYNHVYRFLNTPYLNEDYINDYLFNDNYDFNKYINNNRDYVLDNTPVEEEFEKAFIELFGYENLNKLHKEYSINDIKGNNYVLDYYIESDDLKVAIEENGVSYHHPQIIKEDRYIHQLAKQNTCALNDIKLYRFSSEDISFKDKMLSEMEDFFKDVVLKGKDKCLIGERNFELYEHQKENLKEIKEKRDSGIKTCLVVLPTASGKSKIVEEDLKTFSNKINVLIVAPTKRIVEDWKLRLKGSKHYIEACTYSYIENKFLNYNSNYFDYIVVDEAHHALAPMLKRVIQYFDPLFMIGLTATDQRLDKQKLETVFGQYETKLTLKEAMKNKIVSEARVFRLETNLDLSKVRFNGKDFVNADLERSIRVNSRNELIGEVLNKYFNSNDFINKQGIIFCINVKHALEVNKILNDLNISSAVLSSKTKNIEEVINRFKNKEIRFLCSCNMINEGWDYPEIEILVMARPTMSKVLYEQQIGRGLRKAKNKECVYIIDVVDEYGSLARPWSFNALVGVPMYVPFGKILKEHYEGEIIEINGLVERIERIEEINLDTYEEKYKDYLSVPQLAIDCFVNDMTIVNWIKKGEIIPDLTIPFGAKKIYLFSKENVEKIKRIKNISVHDETTIRKDFYEFLDKKDYTFSFKIVFMLSLLKHADRNGIADIDEVLNDYQRFYLERINNGYKVDRDNCVLNLEKLLDKTYLKKSLLTNPFEKYERKRFMAYSKELNKIALNKSLWDNLTKEDIDELKDTYLKHLEEYYKDLGGLYNIDYLKG